MTKKTVIPDAESKPVGGEAQGAGFGGFLHGPWLPEDPLRDLKLHLLNFLAYPERVKATEIKKLFNSLTEYQREKLAGIMAEFVSAMDDETVVPMLIKVPKSALSSKEGMVRIPASALSSETLEVRRASDAERKRDYRSQMSEEQKAVAREKTAERMRSLRKRRKAI